MPKIAADHYQLAAKLSFYLEQDIPAFHIRSRESQFTLLNLQKAFDRYDRFCYLTAKKYRGAEKVETNFNSPVYILKNISFQELQILSGHSYEEIVRNY